VSKFIVVTALQVVAVATSALFDNSIVTIRCDISFLQLVETGTFVQDDLFDSFTLRNRADCSNRQLRRHGFLCLLEYSRNLS